jgi:PAS domain S-box-containing protein
VNDTVCQLIGYSREELLTMHYRDITFPEDMDIDTGLIQELAAGKIPSYSMEKRYVSKDRKVLTTVITVALVRDKENRPMYFICDIIDVSAQKQMSEELRWRNMQLEAASKNLKNKINQLEDLNHIIAHNLRGPAGAIQMLSEGSDLFAQDEALKMIQSSSTELLNNLEMLMEMSRIKLDQNIRYDVCKLREVIDSIIRQLQGIVYQKHIDIRSVLDVEEVSYPRVYLESILYNLISNSIKYSRTDVQTLIEVTAKNKDGKVQLSVKDNGLGIDLAKHKDNIFKLSQTFHKGYDSKGVGLYITKAQIESLGGAIEVYSQPNSGSNFVITL